MRHNARFEANLKQLGRMLKHVREGIHYSKMDEEQGLRLELAAEEALVNVVTHAYPQSNQGYVEIEWQPVSPHGLQLIIRDSGTPFNPLDVEPPSDLEASIEERKAGGLGIFLIRQLIDEVRYERSKEQNILILLKKA
jgi:serine/threonine-protein kinase RsbW